MLLDCLIRKENVVIECRENGFFFNLSTDHALLSRGRDVPFKCKTVLILL